MSNENDVLYGKTLVALGDSLFYGNKLGNEATWINKLGKKYGMTVYNHGMNGNTVAYQNGEAKKSPMCVRYADMEDGADYVVFIGGANDKRLDVPIGENDSTDCYTFKGALNTVITGLIKKYPKAKMLFMTNYQRWAGVNKIGLYEIDYVNAMEDICHKYAVPCFNNFYNAGISFYHKEQLFWVDEGIAFGLPENHHFTSEAYDWLLNKYESLLRAL